LAFWLLESQSRRGHQDQFSICVRQQFGLVVQLYMLKHV
jgi:hypothetical protein